MKGYKRGLLLLVIMIILTTGTMMAVASGGFSFSGNNPASNRTVQSPNVKISVMVMADANIDKYSARVTLNGTTYTAKFTEWYTAKDGEISYYAVGLKDGLYDVSVSIKDVNGNIGSTSWQFTVAVPPTISELTPVSGSAQQSVARIGAKVQDSNGTINAESIVLKVDGSVVAHTYDASTGFVSYYPESMADGSHPVELYVEDSGKNSKVARWYFSTDNSKPVFTALAPTNGSSINTMSPQISAAIEDAASNLVKSSVAMFINNTQVPATFSYHYDPYKSQYSYNKGTVTFNQQGMADGPYEAVIKAGDSAGNLGTFSWGFTVAVPPNINSLQPQNGAVLSHVRDVSAVVTDPNGTIDPSSVVMSLNNSPVTCVFDAATGKVTYSVPDGFQNGIYSVTLQAADTAGNKTEVSWTFTVDGTPLKFSSFSPAPDNTTNVANPEIKVNIEAATRIKSGTPQMKINGETVHATFAYLQYYNEFYELETDYTKGTLTFRPEALTNSTHTVTVEAEDEAGNRGSAFWGFTVAAPPNVLEITPAADSVLMLTQPAITVDLYSNEVLKAENIHFKVNGMVVKPELTPLGSYYFRLTYKPVWLNDESYLLDLQVTNDSGLSLKKTWYYNINCYGEMPGTAKDISTCALCHDGTAIKETMCGDCHSTDIAGWQGECFDCHRTDGGDPPFKHNYKSIYPHETLKDHELLSSQIGSCRACHSRYLTREHTRSNYTCATCHQHSSQAIQDAIFLGQRDCLSCHTGEAAALAHPAHTVQIGAKCIECHGDNMMTEKVRHNNDCASCHNSSDPLVQNAIRTQQDNCFACHETPHSVFMTTYRSDIPLYSHVTWSTPQPASIWSSEGWLPAELNDTVSKVVFSNREALDAGAVHTFYSTEMQKSGWTLQSDTYSEGVTHFNMLYVKGSRYCAIWCYNGNVPGTSGTNGMRLQIVYH